MSEADVAVPRRHRSEDMRNAARTLNKVMELLRGRYAEMTVQQAQTFLLIAGNPAISVSEIADKLGIASASASRNVSALTCHRSFEKAGLGLARADDDPHDRRIKCCRLTAEGWALLERMTDELARPDQRLAHS